MADFIPMTVEEIDRYQLLARYLEAALIGHRTGMLPQTVFDNHKDRAVYPWWLQMAKMLDETWTTAAAAFYALLKKDNVK